MLQPNEIYLNGNNSTAQVTVRSSEMDHITSLEIAELTGKLHKDVLEAIRVMEPAWEKVAGRKFPLSEYKDSTGRKLPMYELNKTECLYVATKFNDEARAKLVLRWEQLEVRKATPMQPILQPTDSLTEQVKASLAWVEGVARCLNLDNPAKLEMLKQVAAPIGMPVPVYTTVQPVHTPADQREPDPYNDLYLSGKIKSATKLLRKSGSKMKASKFNKRLVEKGYLEVVTVPSDTRGQKRFHRITEAGLEFGVNRSIGKLKDAWPLWYTDRFGRLLELVNQP